MYSTVCISPANLWACVFNMYIGFGQKETILFVSCNINTKWYNTNSYMYIWKIYMYMPLEYVTFITAYNYGPVEVLTKNSQFVVWEQRVDKLECSYFTMWSETNNISFWSSLASSLQWPKESSFLSQLWMLCRKALMRGSDTRIPNSTYIFSK